MLPKSELKYIQSLTHKKFRQQYGQFVAEGPKLVDELMAKQPALLHKLYATSEWWNNASARLKTIVGDRIQVLEPFELNKISNLQTSQEVLAVVLLPDLPVWQVNTTEAMVDGPPVVAAGWTLVLDGIQDPGNLGTIIRTAHWFGVHEIICSPDCADAFAPKVVQSSMGSIFRVSIVYTDLPEMFGANKLPVYGALLHGESVRKKKLHAKGLIVVGNEGQGIRPELLRYVDHPVTVPGLSDAESLNAAIATGIMLYSFTHEI